MKAMTGTTSTGAALLTRQDRCDRCGAAAVLRAVLGCGELLFCGHHAREHGPRLHELGARMSIELSESHSKMGSTVPDPSTAGGTPSWVSHPG